MELHDRIKRVRKSAKLTQYDIAKKLEIAPSTYQYYERGERQPNADFLINLIVSFGVNSAWLLLGEGNMNSAGMKYLDLDLSLLKEVIVGVEEELKEKKRMLTPEKKAEVIALVYEFQMKEEKPKKGTELKTFIRERASKFLRLAT